MKNFITNDKCKPISSLFKKFYNGMRCHFSWINFITAKRFFWYQVEKKHICWQSVPYTIMRYIIIWNFKAFHYILDFYESFTVPLHACLCSRVSFVLSQDFCSRIIAGTIQMIYGTFKIVGTCWEAGCVETNLFQDVLEVNLFIIDENSVAILTEAFP